MLNKSQISNTLITVVIAFGLLLPSQLLAKSKKHRGIKRSRPAISEARRVKQRKIKKQRRLGKQNKQARRIIKRNKRQLRKVAHRRKKLIRRYRHRPYRYSVKYRYPHYCRTSHFYYDSCYDSDCCDYGCDPSWHIGVNSNGSLNFGYRW